MSNFLNKIPVSPITSFGNPSVPNGSTFGTNFSILQTGGFMEVYTLSGLTYTIPPATTGIIEFSGNSIPIQFTKGSGSVFSPDVLTLNSDNISSGRRKLGMLAYVYETNKIYQFRIDNYDTLWNSATGATGPGGPTVVISDFGTTVKNNSAAGIAFINAWTASTISGIGGYDDTNASWRVLSTGGISGGASITGGTFDKNTETLSLNNSTGGTITITGFTDIFVTGGTYSDGTTTFTNNTGGTFTVSGYFTGQTDNTITGGTFDKNTETLSLFDLTGGTITITGFTDVFVTGGTYSGGTIIFTNNSGGTFNVEGLFTGATDVFVTGGTYSAGTTTFTNNTGGTFQVTGYTKQGDYVESVTGDGVDNTDPLNPVINQNAKVNVITVTLGDLGLPDFADNESMLVLSNLYLNSLNEDIPYDTLYQLEIIEGTGTTPTYSTTFISEWNVTNPGDSIVLPYISNGTYYGSIDWGDGTYSINSNSNKIHTYTNSGTYTIKINGIISGFSFLAGGYALTLREIKQWGNLDIGNSGSNFQGCSNLILTGVTDTLKLLSGTTNLQNMFQGCTSITTINNLNDWNVSNVTNMSSMFQNCTSFNQNIGGWDVSKVTTMVNMFRSTSSSGIFNNGGSSSINNWNVSGVTNMSGMFFQQSQFNQPLSGWNVSNVTNMSQMFQMLIFSTNNFNQPIGNWDVSKVTNMSDMFRSLSSFNQPLSGWNVSNVTNMFGMFVRTIFNKNIGNWNVSGVTNMSLMFSTSSFNNEGSPSISGWTTSNVTNMGSMFSQNPSFNQPIGSWNTSNVTNMSQVFQGCTAFNQDIGNWDLSKTTATISMFSNATSFNNNSSSSINNWNVSGVTNMSSMFGNATSFNQPIGSWNVSNVTSFSGFMNGKTNLNYSSANLDLIYNGWSSRPVKPSINISFGSIKYTSGSTAGRNILTNSPNLWTITDGGI
jgi:surface protein